jgi:hypothetical protein
MSHHPASSSLNSQTLPQNVLTSFEIAPPSSSQILLIKSKISDLEKQMRCNIEKLKSIQTSGPQRVLMNKKRSEIKAKTVSSLMIANNTIMKRRRDETDVFPSYHSNLMQASIIKQAKVCSEQVYSDFISEQIHNNKWQAKTVIKSKKVAKKKKAEDHCLFFLKFGQCRSGNSCKFLHDLKKIAICRKLIQTGICNDKNCLLSHQIDPQKMPICMYFQKGVCYNEKCLYRHVKLDNNTSACPDFQKGFCIKGLECELLHIFEYPRHLLISDSNVSNLDFKKDANTWASMQCVSKSTTNTFESGSCINDIVDNNDDKRNDNDLFISFNTYHANENDDKNNDVVKELDNDNSINNSALINCNNSNNYIVSEKRSEVEKIYTKKYVDNENMLNICYRKAINETELDLIFNDNNSNAINFDDDLNCNFKPLIETSIEFDVDDQSTFLCDDFGNYILKDAGKYEEEHLEMNNNDDFDCILSDIKR